jgi:hypothetical protein
LSIGGNLIDHGLDLIWTEANIVLGIHGCEFLFADIFGPIIINEVEHRIEMFLLWLIKKYIIALTKITDELVSIHDLSFIVDSLLDFQLE